MGEKDWVGFTNKNSDVRDIACKINNTIKETPTSFHFTFHEGSTRNFVFDAMIRTTNGRKYRKYNGLIEDIKSATNSVILPAVVFAVFALK